MLISLIINIYVGSMPSTWQVEALVENCGIHLSFFAGPWLALAHDESGLHQ
jgi:hypothetical protein